MCTVHFFMDQTISLIIKIIIWINIYYSICDTLGLLVLKLLLVHKEVFLISPESHRNQSEVPGVINIFLSSCFSTLTST